jgi:hypothetical protein
MEGQQTSGVGRGADRGATLEPPAVTGALDTELEEVFDRESPRKLVAEFREWHVRKLRGVS